MSPRVPAGALSRRQRALLIELRDGEQVLPYGPRSRPFHALRFAGLVEFKRREGAYTAGATYARLTPAGRALADEAAA